MRRAAAAAQEGLGDAPQPQRTITFASAPQQPENRTSGTPLVRTLLKRAKQGDVHDVDEVTVNAFVAGSCWHACCAWTNTEVLETIEVTVVLVLDSATACIATVDRHALHTCCPRGIHCFIVAGYGASGISGALGVVFACSGHGPRVGSFVASCAPSIAFVW